MPNTSGDGSRSERLRVEQALLHGDRRLGGVREVQRVHVGPGLDPARDQVLPRPGDEADDRDQGEHQGDRPPVPERRDAGAAQQPRPPGQQGEHAHEQRDADRAHQGAPQHVLALRVAELVRHDQLDLPVRRRVEQRVVDDDPPGRAEARDVGVERRRTPGGVGDEHVLDRHAVLARQVEQRGPQLAGRHRGELVEHRLHHDRVSEGHHHHEQRGDRGADGPPPLRRPARQPDDQEEHHQGQHQPDAVALGDVGEPAAPRPGRQPVVATDALGPGVPRQHQQPADQRQHDGAEQHLPAPAAAKRLGHPPDDARAEGREAQQRGEQQRDQHRHVGRRPDRRVVGVLPRDLGRGEVTRRVDRDRLDPVQRQRSPRREHRDQDGEHHRQHDGGDDESGPARHVDAASCATYVRHCRTSLRSLTPSDDSTSPGQPGPALSVMSV